MADKDKKVTGGAGMRPPADAPVETAQPLTADLIQHQRAQAARNERELPPFNPKPMGPPPETPKPSVVQTVQKGIESLTSALFGTDAPTAIAPEVTAPLPVLPDTDPTQASVDQMADLPPLSDEDRARMPAASNTDTPTKGLLPNLVPPTGDKFDGIARGGFGDFGEESYFPLNGDEVKECVLALFDQLAAQIPNDLRFSMALTYPRARIRVRVEVEGHVEDSGDPVVIEKVFRPKEGEAGGTPLEIARQLADQVVFVVEAKRQEFTESGEVDQPPDAIREELALPRPRRQLVDTVGRQKMSVDVIPTR